MQQEADERCTSVYFGSLRLEPPLAAIRKFGAREKLPASAFQKLTVDGRVAATAN